MELMNYDWKTFQSFFYSKKKMMLAEAVPTTPIYLVTDKKVVISAFSNGEDLSDWLGSTGDEVAHAFPHRDFVLYEQEQINQKLNEVVDLSHYYDQIQCLHQEVKPQFILRERFQGGMELLGHQHFLFQAVAGWWKKILPSNYGIYIRLTDGGPSSSLLVVVKKGKVCSFYTPDISGMIAERRKRPTDVVKYLSERYSIPVRGIYVSSAEWAEWTEIKNPWPRIAATLKVNRDKLVPFQWGITALIGIKALFGF
jgi:hypothetical protein